jgi:hypothetical protein
MHEKGYIYLMRDDRSGFVKIGFSQDPIRRLKQITHESTLLPEPLNFRLVDAFRGTQKEEQRLHQVFAQYRVRGEWFDLCFWRYMTLVDAFDCRERMPGMQWERCGDWSEPFECFDDIDSCKCPECSPWLWRDKHYLGPRRDVIVQ